MANAALSNNNNSDFSQATPTQLEAAVADRAVEFAPSIEWGISATCLGSIALMLFFLPILSIPIASCGLAAGLGGITRGMYRGKIGLRWSLVGGCAFECRSGARHYLGQCPGRRNSDSSRPPPRLVNDGPSLCRAASFRRSMSEAPALKPTASFFPQASSLRPRISVMKAAPVGARHRLRHGMIIEPCNRPTNILNQCPHKVAANTVSHQRSLDDDAGQSR